MSDDPTDLNGLDDFARRLAGAAPSPGGLNRDALLFAAGRASAPPRGRYWAGACAGLGLLAAGLGAALVVRPVRVVEIERVVYVPAPAPPAPIPTPAPTPHPRESQPPGVPPEVLAAEPEGDTREFVRRYAHLFRESGAAGEPATAWATPAGSGEPIPDLASLRILVPTTVERNP